MHLAKAQKTPKFSQKTELRKILSSEILQNFAQKIPKKISGEVKCIYIMLSLGGGRGILI